MKKENYQDFEDFKKEAVAFYHANRALGLSGCSKHLGVRSQDLFMWQKELCYLPEFQTVDTVVTNALPSLMSDEEKEIRRLKQELKETREALDIMRNAVNSLQGA